MRSVMPVGSSCRRLSLIRSISRPVLGPFEHRRKPGQAPAENIIVAEFRARKQAMVWYLPV